MKDNVKPWIKDDDLEHVILHVGTTSRTQKAVLKE